jgi:hypothetical protein
MSPRNDEVADRAQVLAEALAEALAGVDDRGSSPAPDTVDYRWLGIGMRLGLERPDHARHLLELITADARLPAATPEGDVAGRVADHGDAPTEPAAPEDAAPAASRFLARSAALPATEMAVVGRDVVFGWATELTPEQVLRIGSVVIDMLAKGASADIGRGFGLAWDGGVRIPRSERDRLFEDFTQLEVTVAEILGGRDLRSVAAAPRPQGFGAFAQLFGTRPQGPSPVTAAIDAAGEPGRHGLVALWNAWMAMRYRSAMPAATFELLVRPWVTVAGPLPDR